MPDTVPPTCTTVRGCDTPATREIRAGGKIRGLPARSSVTPVHLLACDRHLPIAAGFTKNRETRTITELPPVQPTLFNTEE